MKNAPNRIAFEPLEPRTFFDGAAFSAPLLDADAISTSQINLTWTQPSDDRRVQLEAKGPGDSNFHIVPVPASSPTNLTVHPVTGLATNSDYAFRLRADRFGLVAYSDAYASTLSGSTSGPVPSRFQAYLSPGYETVVKLEWDDDVANETGFEIQMRSPDFSPAWTNWHYYTSTAANGTTFETSPLCPSVPHSFRIRTLFTNGASEWSRPSNIVTGGIRPQTPTVLTIGNTTTLDEEGEPAIQVSWNYPSADIAGFYLFEASDGVTGHIVADRDADARSFVLPLYRLSAATVAKLTVVAYDSGNTLSKASQPATYLVSGSASSPQAPANLESAPYVAQTGFGVRLIWDNVSNAEDGYLISRQYGTNVVTFTPPADVTSYDDTTAKAAVEYVYSVSTKGSGGGQFFNGDHSADCGCRSK